MPGRTEFLLHSPLRPLPPTPSIFISPCIGVQNLSPAPFPPCLQWVTPFLHAWFGRRSRIPGCPSPCARHTAGTPVFAPSILRAARRAAPDAEGCDPSPIGRPPGVRRTGLIAPFGPTERPDEDLLDFIALSSADAVSTLKKSSSLGVRGVRVHDLMHAEAAIQYGADELLTLDDSGFASLNLSLQVAAPWYWHNEAQHENSGLCFPRATACSDTGR